MKKAIAALLSFVMVIGVLCSTPMTVFAYEIDGPLYFMGMTGAEDYYMVGCDDKEYAGEIVIPSTYNNLPVKELDYAGFENCPNITSITIPETVEIIWTVFDGCYSLQEFIVHEDNPEYSSVEGALCDKSGTVILSIPKGKEGTYILPEPITKISADALTGAKITGITLNSNYQELVESPFQDCSNLEAINVSPENPVFSSEDGVLFNKDKTTLLLVPVAKKGDYTVPSTVTTIDTGAFNYSTLTSVTVGGNVKLLSHGAFSSSGISGITLEEGIEVIDSYCFANCYNLTSLKIPSGVKKVGGAFVEECDNIKEIEFGDNIGELESSVINKIESLEKLTFGSNIKNISPTAFYDLLKIETLNVKELESWISVQATSDYQTDYSDIFKISENIYVDGKDISEITEITISREHNFSNTISALNKCTSLKEFKLPENPQGLNYKVEDGVLYNFDKTSIVKYPTGKTGEYIFPETVTKINDGAFAGATGLTEIEIPERFGEISQNMFKDCVNLEKITLPSSVTEIPLGAFYNTGFKVLEIPETVTKIGENAFAYCKKLETVKLPKNLTVIQNSAFIGSAAKDCYVSNETVTSSVGRNLNAENVYFTDDVRVIDEGAFKANLAIKTVTFSDSVYEISEEAFYDCENLTALNFGMGLLEVGEDAFANCSSLEKVNLKNIHFWCNVKFYDMFSNPLIYTEKLYLNDVLVEKLVIPEGVIAIEPYAFYGCSSIKSVTIPSSVRTIKSCAFGRIELEALNIEDIASWCDVTIEDSSALALEEFGGRVFVDGEPITELVIPENVTKIPSYAFKGWSIESVKFLGNVTEICESAFTDCCFITEVDLPESIESVSYYAFENCASLQKINVPSIEVFCRLKELPINDGVLTVYIDGELPEEIVIPESVKTIRPYMFHYFSSLKKVTLPKDVELISEYAFANCPVLEEIVIPGKVAAISDNAFEGSGVIRDVHIEDLDAWCETIFANTTSNPLSIAGNLYSNGELVTELIISDGVTCISPWAFYGCEKLEKVVLPDSVKIIDKEAFAECTSLKEIDFGSGLEEIGERAFMNDTALTKLEIPESLKKVNQYAFSGCRSLTGVYITDLSKWCNIDFSDALGLSDTGNPLIVAKNLYLNGELIEDLVIPEDITEIGLCTFRGAGIKTVTLHDGVTKINLGAFAGCVELEEVTLSENLTSIMREAFSTCKKLKSIKIPDNVSFIGYGAFSNCSSLESVVFPANLTEIQKLAFSNCTELKSVIINNALKSLPEKLFDGCNNLVSIKIPKNVTSINTDALPKTKQQPLTTIYGVANSAAHSFYKKYPSYFNFVDYTTVSEPNNNVQVKENRYVVSNIPKTNATGIVNVPAGYVVMPIDTGGDNIFIGTGSLLGVYDEYNTLVNTVEVVVMGDLNGDGVCDVLDCMLAELARTSCVTLEGGYLTAGDYTEDLVIDTNDLTQVVNKAVDRT